MEAAEGTEGGLRASIMEARTVIIGPARAGVAIRRIEITTMKDGTVL